MFAKINALSSPLSSGSKGFTLIELLIAVTILGILTTMAIPVYMGHQARAQLTEAVTLGGSHRVNIEDYILNNGAFPEDEMTLSLIPWVETVDGELIRRYPSVASVELTPTGDASTGGEIQIEIAQTNGIASEIRGHEVVFRRTPGGTWFCETSVEASIVPKGCNHAGE